MNGNRLKQNGIVAFWAPLQVGGDDLLDNAYGASTIIAQSKLLLSWPDNPN